MPDHPRERGVAENDVTSYLASQREWGPDRDRDWPKIEDNLLHRYERQSYPIPNYKPEIWYDAGRTVLDLDNHAILKYKIIPAVLSSEFSGRDMEAIRRLDLRITRQDFRARMPSTILSRCKGKKQVRKPLYTLSAIGMRTRRFRQENGLVSWTGRQGSDTTRKLIVDHMPEANLKANSTQGMSLPTLFEQGASRASNKGQYPSRVGDQALPDDVKRERAQKVKEKLEKLHAAQFETEQRLIVPVGRKRGREDDGISETEEESRPSKRSRHGDALESNPDIAASFPVATLPREPLLLEGNFLTASQPAGHKRSHEQSSSEEENCERPSKRRRSEMLSSQPTTISYHPTILSQYQLPRKLTDENASEQGPTTAEDMNEPQPSCLQYNQDQMPEIWSQAHSFQHQVQQMNPEMLEDMLRSDHPPIDMAASGNKVPIFTADMREPKPSIQKCTRDQMPQPRSLASSSQRQAQQMTPQTLENMFRRDHPPIDIAGSGNQVPIFTADMREPEPSIQQFTRVQMPQTTSPVSSFQSEAELMATSTAKTTQKPTRNPHRNPPIQVPHASTARGQVQQPSTYDVYSALINHDACALWTET